jgi:hypothetical protein
MAVRLPDVESFGPRPIPTSRRPIASDRSGEILAGAVDDAGNALGNIAELKMALEDKFNYSTAKSAVLMADIEARKELENDRDFETHEKRYREKIAKAREAATASIRSVSDRATFELDSNLDLERGAAAIRDHAKSIETDIARSTLEEIGNSARTGGLEATDEETRAAIIENHRDAIDGAVDKGYLSAEEATKRKQAWTVEFAESYLKTLPAEQRIALLSKPDTNESRFLDKDVRVKLLDEAQKEDRELRVRSESQRQADRIMTNFADRSYALADARRIRDPEVRDATVARVNAQFNEEKLVLDERQDTAFTEAGTLVERTGSIDDIDASTWQNVLSLPQRQALEARAKQLRDGTPPKTDQALWYEIRKQATDDPQAFAKRNLMFDRPSLDDGDFQSLADLQAQVKAGGGKADKTLSGIRTNEQVVNGALREIGIDYGDGASVEQNTRANDFRRKVDDKVLDRQRATGKEVTLEEVQAITDGLILEVDVPRALWFDRTTRVFESDDLSSIPTQDVVEIEKALRKRNLPVTDAAILSLYNDGLAIE